MSTNTRLGGFLATLIFCFFSTTTHANTFGFGTMGQGTNSYATGAAITKLLVQDLGIEARVQPSGGTTDFLPALNAGELDFGIANVLEAYQAYSGTGPWNGQAQSNVRVIAPTAPLRVAYFVHADSDIKTIADLKGKRITTRFPRIQTLGTVVPAVLANAGLTLDNVIEVPVPHVVPGADAFLDGRVDAFFFAVVPSKPAEVHASVPIRALPFDTSEESVARMTEIFPQGRIDSVKPIPPLPYITEPTAVMAYDNLMIAGSHVPDDVIMKIAEGLANGKNALGEAYAPLRAFDPGKIGKGELGTPYHDGIKAWLENQ